MAEPTTKCSECSNEVFENNKCILHCEKDNFSNKESNTREFKNLLTLHANTNECYQGIYFPKEVEISTLSKTNFKSCVFYKKQEIKTGVFEGCTFNNTIKLLGKATFNKCIINRHIIVSSVSFNKDTMSELIFSDKTILLFKCDIGSSFFNVIRYYSGLIKRIYFNFNKTKGVFDISDIKSNNIFKFYKCSFQENFIMKSSFCDNLSFIHCKFLTDTDYTSKVKIQFSDIKKASFFNTTFNDLADFYQTKFGEVNFKRADFEKISVFSECKFDCDLDFKYVKFLSKSIFRDTIITGKLNLRDTIFNDEANFLDITKKSRWNEEEKRFIGEPTSIDVENRETARIIKNSYDNSNNIIEGNRFYKLEMKAREKELQKKLTKLEDDNNVYERFVFKLHGLSSNHSQSWALALFWIIFISTSVSLYEYHFFMNLCDKDKLVTIFPMDILKSIYIALYVVGLTAGALISLLLNFKLPNILTLLIYIYIGIYIYITENYNLSPLAKVINPFSIMGSNEGISVMELIIKIIITYLIYQLITAVRQNTRRK